MVSADIGTYIVYGSKYLAPVSNIVNVCCIEIVNLCCIEPS